VEAIVTQVGDVGVGFRRGLAVGPELKLVMFGVEGAIAPNITPQLGSAIAFQG